MSVQNNFNIKCQYKTTLMPSVDTIQLYCQVSTQNNFIAKCWYNCTSNVLWSQVHSPHIDTSHRTSLHYNNIKHPGHRPTFFCSSPIETQPTCLHPEELKYKAKKTKHFFCRNINRTTRWSLWIKNTSTVSTFSGPTCIFGLVHLQDHCLHLHVNPPSPTTVFTSM